MEEWDNAPQLPAALEWVWDAYHTLSASRQLGMTVGPIPFEAVDRYAARYEIDGEDFDDFLAMISAIDAVYLGHHHGAESQPATPDLPRPQGSPTDA